MKTGKIISVLCLAFLPQFVLAQDTAARIQMVSEKLAGGRVSVNGILSDTSLMKLHSLISFREVIKKNAVPGKVKMISDTEPGTRITVKGTVTDSFGKPLINALVYAYQTSDKGWYSDTAAHILIFMGDFNHARLFAYFKTDSEGKFEIETIMPKGYPRSDLPAHIHIHFWKNGEPVYGAPGELQFEDDPRMTPERKKKSLEEGFLISPNSGTAKKPVYYYKIKTNWN